MSDVSANLDKRRNRVTDPDLQNSFKQGMQESMPRLAEDDDPAWTVEIKDALAHDLNGILSPIKNVGEVLALVHRGLTNGGTITITPHRQESVPTSGDADDSEIIDADVID